MSYIYYPIVEEFDPADEKKTRTITIKKCPVFDDINNITYKFMEAQKAPSDSQENAIASDNAEDHDGMILHFDVNHRDARLRKRISFAMATPEEPIEEADNDPDDFDTEAAWVYNLSVSTKWNDALLQPTATLIHDYLVWGALHDWYLECGYLQQAAAIAKKVQDFEDEIFSNLRQPSRAKRPLQPFGPAKKMF